MIFDMDGVVTDTASVHAAAWKRMFDGFLREHGERTGESFREFTGDDYRRYLDGKPRHDGIRSFLESRGIELPEGEPDDPEEQVTVRGLGRRKNRMFLDELDREGPRAYSSTLTLVRNLREREVRTAIISASRNMQRVLEAARVKGLFEVHVDGVEADRIGFPGKPDPAVFLEAAKRLDVQPGRAAVVEDAVAGVEAGRRGRFALVVGVDRTGHPEALLEAGAHVVVADLSELELETDG